MENLLTRSWVYTRYSTRLWIKSAGISLTLSTLNTIQTKWLWFWFEGMNPQILVIYYIFKQYDLSGSLTILARSFKASLLKTYRWGISFSLYTMPLLVTANHCITATWIISLVCILETSHQFSFQKPCPICGSSRKSVL